MHRILFSAFVLTIVFTGVSMASTGDLAASSNAQLDETAEIPTPLENPLDDKARSQQAIYSEINLADFPDEEILEEPPVPPYEETYAMVDQEEYGEDLVYQIEE